MSVQEAWFQGFWPLIFRAHHQLTPEKKNCFVRPLAQLCSITVLELNRPAGLGTLVSKAASLISQSGSGKRTLSPILRLIKLINRQISLTLKRFIV